MKKIGKICTIFLMVTFLVVVLSTLIKPICSKGVDIAYENGSFYVYYQDQVYEENVDAHLSWNTVWNYEFVKTGWHWADVVFLVQHQSNRIENPDFIILNNGIAFREDFDPLTQRLRINSSSIPSDFEFCFSDLMQEEPMYLSEIFDNSPKKQVFNLYVSLKDNPGIYKCVEIFQYNDEYYVHLDDFSQTYKYLYYRVPNEYVEVFRKFWKLQ